VIGVCDRSELAYGSSNSKSDIAPHLPIDVSPQCQQNALQFIDTHFGGALGDHYCRRLSYEHQKLLALELTKCHLADAGQSAFERTCHAAASQECISLLNDRGFHSYTTFKVHVEQYCLKLNHDLMIYRQQELGVQLQQSAQRATVQFTELIDQQDAMKEQYSHLFVTLTEQQTELHSSLLQQSLKRQEQLEQQVLQRQELQEQQLHEWLQDLMTGQTHEMQLQRKELQNLSTAVGTTTLQLKPLLGMDRVLGFITNGVNIGSLLVYLYIALNVICLLTLPSCVRACRKRLFGLAMLEFLLNGIILVQLEETTQEDWIDLTSFGCRTLQVGTYAVSLVMFCCTAREPPEQQQKELTQVVNSVKDTVERLQRQSGEREERLIQLIREQNRQNVSNGFYQQDNRNLQLFYRHLEGALEKSSDGSDEAWIESTPYHPQMEFSPPHALASRYKTPGVIIPCGLQQQQHGVGDAPPEEKIVFHDAVAVTPSPKRNIDGSAIAKRPRSESDELEQPSKKQRSGPAGE